MSNFIAAIEIDFCKQRLITMIEKATASELVNLFEGRGVLHEWHDRSTPNGVAVRGDKLMVTLARPGKPAAKRKRK